MKLTDANRPLRVLEKVLQGGLGKGNVGVIMARHGMGKIAVMTSIAMDCAMDGRNTLHMAVNESVADVRAYDDEVVNEILTCLDIADRPQTLAVVERHKQIYTYRSGGFSLDRMEETLNFLTERAEFKPELIELQGWPDFSSVDVSDLRRLKEIAQRHECEIWCACHTKREDQLDGNGVPTYIANALDHIEVLIGLEPTADHVKLNFVKTHDASPAQGVHLEFDPKSMLIRWR